MKKIVSALVIVLLFLMIIPTPTYAELDESAILLCQRYGIETIPGRNDIARTKNSIVVLLRVDSSNEIGVVEYFSNNTYRIRSQVFLPADGDTIRFISYTQSMGLIETTVTRCGENIFYTFSVSNFLYKDRRI